MALLLRKSDRIKVKVEELELEIAPLTFAAKMEINNVLVGASQDDINASMKASKIAMMHSIKSVKGIKCLDGEEYLVELKNDMLTEECVDDLLNLELCPKLMMVCTGLLTGISEKIIDPSTGKELEGVKVKMPGKKKAK